MNGILIVSILSLICVVAVQSWKIVDFSATLQNRTPLSEEKFMYYFFGIPALVGIFWLMYSVIPM